MDWNYAIGLFDVGFCHEGAFSQLQYDVHHVVNTYVRDAARLLVDPVVDASIRRRREVDDQALA